MIFLFKNYTCDIEYEKFPFVFLPLNTSKLPHSTLLFLNPFVSWSTSASINDYNQIVNVETYQRLIKQEMNELHTLANSSSSQTNSRDHFQPYYTNFGESELNELHALSASLNEMLEHLDAKDECFSLGVLSAIVANELNHSATSKQRRKVSKQLFKLFSFSILLKKYNNFSLKFAFFT